MIRKILGGLLGSVLYIAAYFGCSWGAAAILARYPEHDNLVGLLLLASLLFSVFVLVVNRRKLMKRGWFTSFNSRELGHVFRLALGTVLLVTFVVAFLFPAFFDTLKTKELVEQLGSLADFDPMLVLLAVGVVAPFTEELLFRGAIQNLLREKIHPGVAILASALLFAAFHLNLYQASYTVFVGLIAALLVEATGSLWLAVFYHIFYNTAGAFLDLLGPELQDFLFARTYLAPILGGVLLATSLKYFLAKGR